MNKDVVNEGRWSTRRDTLDERTGRSKTGRTEGAWTDGPETGNTRGGGTDGGLTFVRDLKTGVGKRTGKKRKICKKRNHKRSGG